MLSVFYAVILVALTIFSYSQIDLNLTLSANAVYQRIQHELILLGYYNRPLSAGILIILLILLYFFYLRILFLVKNKKITSKSISWLVIASSVILFFAYSAFSHDLFNYMFDARIVTHYGQNPYFHSALDFPADLWTRFMHWTHRTYPYGPVWLILTLPFSFLGFGKFVVTLINFKLMFILFHLGNVYLIQKILSKTDKEKALLGTAVYAFNPVVLIESLVSPHNEVMMLFFLLLSIYEIYVKKRKISGFACLLLSAGIKFVTLVLLPLFLFIRQIKSKKEETILFIGSLILLSATLIFEIIYREPYSWYFLPVIGLVALLVRYPAINILVSGISMAAFLRYLPFIYFGDYDKMTQTSQNLIFIVVTILSFFTAFYNLFSTKLQKKKN